MEHRTDRSEMASICELHIELNLQASVHLFTYVAAETHSEHHLINEVEFLPPLQPLTRESFMSRTSLLNQRYVEINIPLE
jgi:hypothetical protein